MVPVRSLAEVQGLDAGKLNTAALNRVCRELGTGCVMVFTFETELPESTVHVRMFAPLLVVPEDPATGSANGALGGLPDPPSGCGGDRANHLHRQ